MSGPPVDDHEGLEVSEGRQLTLLLAAGVALMLAGVAGAALFPEACDDLEALGTLEIEFTDAVDALPIDPTTAAAVEALGTDLKIGPWRGAVALPTDATLMPSESGLFVVTDTDVVATRPLIGVTSAARGRAGVRLLQSTNAFALVDDDGTIGVFDGEYEQERCGVLDGGADVAVLDLDRGFAVTADGLDAEATLRTLGEDVIWTAPLAESSGPPHAMIDRDHVTIVTGNGVITRVLRTGDVTGEVDLNGAAALQVDRREGQILLLVPATGALSMVTVTDGIPTVELVELPTRGDVLGVHTARLTPHGIVAARGTELLTDRGAVAALPDGLRVIDLQVSGNGFVGVLVEADDGARAVLYYGPDAD